MKCRARFPIMLVIAVIVAGIDRLSKMWFLQHFYMGESRQVTPFLYLTLVHNTGTAFGLFQNNNKALLGVAYAVLLLFIYAARGLCERGGRWGFWGVALILGGAIGNIIDRHLYGHVIDFIDLRVWPVFNVADSAITVGAACTAIGLLRQTTSMENRK
jgi:signal peptidase II